MAGGSILAVAYFCISTERQEASIPTQRAEVEKLDCNRGYNILREYTDDGISGDDTERRAGFSRFWPT